MIRFTQHKKLNLDIFSKYIRFAESTNQFTNYGKAVQLLEDRARELLKIQSSKAIIAVCNGAAALNTIIATIRTNEPVFSQDFTFPCNFQIPDVHTESFDLNEVYEPDIHKVDKSGIVIITNCFGHVLDLDNIMSYAAAKNQKIIFDNAASPYSFYKGYNISNYGIASYISLHHTKPIGFGEGGLIVIDKDYEEKARAIINFGLINKIPTYRGNNYKMSELAASGILQWWDSFHIDDLKDKYMKAYNKYSKSGIKLIPNYSNNFFPNCLPVIGSKETFRNMDVRKYYVPNAGLPYSLELYNKIMCVPITEYLDD